MTNARSPGAKCYGFVAMATSDAAKKCLIHLHKTDLHGRLITVEYVRVFVACFLALTSVMLIP